MNVSATEQKIRTKNTEAPIALVIGSGFGGLAAAVRMCAKGWRVQVLEKLNEPGGRARVIRVDGYTFDAGPTIITVPFLLEDLWKLAGRTLADDVELRLLDPFYRIRFDDGDHFDYSADPERMRDEVLRIDPTALPGYTAFMAEADLCYELGFDDDRLTLANLHIEQRQSSDEFLEMATFECKGPVIYDQTISPKRIIFVHEESVGERLTKAH